MTRSAGKPGEVQLVLGLLLIILAVGFYFGQTEVGDVQDAELKANGIVAEAWVKAKSIETESFTDRKGRPRTRTIHLLNVEHDLGASTKYADWAAKHSLAVSTYPAMTTTDFDVLASDHARISVGQKVKVIVLPTDPGTMELVENFEYRTSARFHLLLYLGLGAALLAGLYFTVAGVRKWSLSNARQL